MWTRRISISKKETYGAIEGMLETLGDDGHTRFLTPAEREQNDQSLSGTYVGIGVQLEEREGRGRGRRPDTGSPAEKAGISTDDVLLAVDGKSVRGDDVSEVVEKVKGPEGTEVELTVLHEGEKQTYDLQRAEIDSPVASWTMIPDTDVAVVLLSSFSDDSAQELQDAFEEAQGGGGQALYPRPQEQSWRQARPGRGDGGIFPRAGERRLHPQGRLRRARGDHGRGRPGIDTSAARGTGQRRFGVERRDPGRSPEGQRQGDRDRGDHLRHGHRALRVRPEGRLIHPARRRRVAYPRRRLYPRTGDHSQT